MPDQKPAADSVWDLAGKLRRSLDQGLLTMDLDLAVQQRCQLIDYLMLLQRWNKVHNLTAVRDVHAMVPRHLLDSLSVFPFLGDEVKTLLDVGSGAGLPGIPLSIAQTDLSCLMVDSSARKTRFIQQAIATLKLENASVTHARVQDIKQVPVDCVVARAFSSPVDIIQSSQHLCAVGGKMIFMMGHLENHLENLPAAFEVEAVHQIAVPDTDATRHLAICRRTAQ